MNTPHSAAPRDRPCGGRHPARFSTWIVPCTCAPHCSCIPPRWAAAASRQGLQTSLCNFHCTKLLPTPSCFLSALSSTSLHHLHGLRGFSFSLPGFGAQERNSEPGSSRSVGGWDRHQGQPTTFNPVSSTLNPIFLILKPETLKPQLSTLDLQPSSIKNQHSAISPQPPTLISKPSTLNPQPSTLNPQPLTLANNAPP